MYSLVREVRGLWSRRTKFGCVHEGSLHFSYIPPPHNSIPLIISQLPDGTVSKIKRTEKNIIYIFQMTTLFSAEIGEMCVLFRKEPLDSRQLFRAYAKFRHEHHTNKLLERLVSIPSFANYENQSSVFVDVKVL
jgi:hypothetical protein